jgi:hypothetical protein
MDVNKMLAEMWKQLCNLQQQFNGGGVNGLPWFTGGNLGITKDDFLGSINEADLIFKTFDLERARITKAGLFGVGTSSPTTTLDISGQIRIRGGVPGTGKILVSDNNGVGSWQTSTSFPSASVIPYISTSFDPDGITVTDTALNGRTYEIFFNDLNRIIYNEVGNQEWDYVLGGGFKILLPGFDANTNNYHLYVFIKS